MALIYHNDIDPSTLVDLPDETKLVETKDPRGPNASDFTLVKEDHTIANMVRTKLHANRRVKFAGYKVPHPTKHDVILKVQTVAEAGEKTPAPTPSEALAECLRYCMDDATHFKAAFELAYETFQRSGAGQ
jgi:DNA-directed RNA polymerase II subunit RPB11